MKGKNVVRMVGGTLGIIFLVVYFGMASGYLEVENRKKTALTQEAMEKYEQDLKAGKKIDLNNYLVKEKVYSNHISEIVLGTSSVIEKGFNVIMNYLFREVDKAVKSK